VHAPLDRPPVLVEHRDQLAGHKPQPRPVGRGLVLAVDGGDRVLEVDDRRDGGLQHDVGDAGVVLAPHPVAGVDRDLDVQAVAAQQHRGEGVAVAAVPGELLGVGQRRGSAGGLDDELARVVHPVRGDVRVGALAEREELVEQPVNLGDHLRAAPGVVARFQLVVKRQGVRAVQRVEQRAPTGVRGVERVPRHGRGHDELWARDLGDLPVHPLHLHARLLERQEVADLGEEPLVGLDVARAVLRVPGVDPSLQLVAPGQQLGRSRHEPLLQPGERRPEPLGIEVETGQQLVGHEGPELGVDLHLPAHRLGHGRCVPPGRARCCPKTDVKLSECTLARPLADVSRGRLRRTLDR
jgi:hypothetical protein